LRAYQPAVPAGLFTGIRGKVVAGAALCLVGALLLADTVAAHQRRPVAGEDLGV
jgi:hypothetical protein